MKYLIFLWNSSTFLLKPWIQTCIQNTAEKLGYWLHFRLRLTFSIGLKLSDNSLSWVMSWKAKLGTMLSWLWFKSNFIRLLRLLKACLSMTLTWHWLRTISCKFTKLVCMKISSGNWLIGLPISSSTWEKSRAFSFVICQREIWLMQ